MAKTTASLFDLPLGLMELPFHFIEAANAISNNLLLPVGARRELIDALGRADEAHETGLPSGDDYDFDARLAYRREMYTAFGARATKIATDAQELLTAMEGDIVNVTKHGDWEAVQAHLKMRRFISNELADFLIATLDRKGPRSKRPPGAKTRPQNRPPAAKTAVRNREIRWFVLSERERNVGSDKSIDNAADKFGLGKRYVQMIASPKNLDIERPILIRVLTLLQEIKDLTVKLDEHKCALRFAK